MNLAGVASTAQLLKRNSTTFRNGETWPAQQVPTLLLRMTGHSIPVSTLRDSISEVQPWMIPIAVWMRVTPLVAD